MAVTPARHRDPDAAALAGASAAVRRVEHAIVFVDVVESVRLVEADEVDFFLRWTGLVGELRAHLRSIGGGRLVKVMGDGAVLAFDEPTGAVRVGLQLRRLAARSNEAVADARRLHLRIGVAHGSVIVDGEDLFGHAVNVATRILTAAEPDDLLVTEGAFAKLDLTALAAEGVTFDDLGTCHLKHVSEAVHLHRVRRPADRVRMPTFTSSNVLKPRVLILPFRALPRSAATDDVGDVLTHEVTRLLVRAREIEVLSRLAWPPGGSATPNLRELAIRFGAGFVVGGRFRRIGERLVVDVEMDEVRTGRTLWSGRFDDGGAELGSSPEPSVAQRIAAEVTRRVVDAEIARTRAAPLVTLDAHTLMVSSVALMHRLSPQGFHRARQTLEALIERLPRQPQPLIQLASWHVLRSIQGIWDDPAHEIQVARDCVHRALNADPRCPTALATAGLVETHLTRRLDLAQEYLATAVSVDPDHALALSFKSALHAFTDDGPEAVRHASRAVALAPPGPGAYLFDALAASAHLTDGNLDMAEKLAARSLHDNPQHASALRVLTAALQLKGDGSGARRAAKKLRHVDPAFEVTSYAARVPSAGYDICKTIAGALREAGLPA